VALIVGVDDLDAAVAQIQERGGDVFSGPADRPDWGIRVAFLRDPDGTLIEVNAPMPRSEWTEDLKREAEAND
jgi:predicted enzyme related to lactoylglutathione lyase